MGFVDIHDIKKVSFKKLENNHIICDLEWYKPKKIKEWVESEKKFKMVTFHPMELDSELKLDMSNPKLLEKVKELSPKDEVYVRYLVPKGVDVYNFKEWIVVDIFDEIDLLEYKIKIQNKNCLFSIPSEEEQLEQKLKAKRTEATMKKSKKKVSSKDKK